MRFSLPLSASPNRQQRHLRIVEAVGLGCRSCARGNDIEGRPRSRRKRCRSSDAQPREPAGRSPAMAFCSNSTSGTLPAGGGAGHRHAGVSAQPDNRRDEFLAEKTPGRQIAWPDFRRRTPRLRRRRGATAATATRNTRSRLVAAACRSKGFPPPQNVIRTLRNHRRKSLGDRQAGEQMSSRASTAENDMNDIVIHDINGTRRA